MYKCFVKKLLSRIWVEKLPNFKGLKYYITNEENDSCNSDYYRPCFM